MSSASAASSRRRWTPLPRRRGSPKAPSTSTTRRSRPIYDAVFASGHGRDRTAHRRPARRRRRRLERRSPASSPSAPSTSSSIPTSSGSTSPSSPATSRPAPTNRSGSCQLALERQTRALQTVMEKAVAAGEVRSVDPEAAALAVFDMSKGLIGRRLLIGSRSSVTTDITFLTDLIWSGLAARARKEEMTVRRRSWPRPASRCGACRRRRSRGTR